MGTKGKESPMDVSVRTFRPEDLKQVQRLYQQTRFYGAGSPTRLAFSRFLLSPTAYVLYACFFMGTCIFLRSPPGYLRYFGATVSVLSGVAIWSIAFPIGMFIFFGLRALLRGDMKDVATHYRLTEAQRGVRGASSFWVAEVETPAGKKIVGSVGLDHFSNDDTTKAELRRMFVSPDFRGHGIAKKLMNALLDHAREQGLEEVYLQTTGLNDKAVIMYQKTGWELVKKHVWRRLLLEGEGYDFCWRLDREEKRNSS
ncbi:hypothetical protein V5O48_012212 [Marasmius crinis-equi]|uniref:N-acetyltransferase domain-containing protein n=1 Tax=Marasmius crinis-equi TaxID=585013 RepID=A0ABR3F3F4_9AGAR